jgi:hypothetical protein
MSLRPSTRLGSCTAAIPQGSPYPSPERSSSIEDLSIAQLDDVVFFRERAKELRQDSTRFSSADLIALALRVADLYELLASKLEALGPSLEGQIHVGPQSRYHQPLPQ